MRAYSRGAYTRGGLIKLLFKLLIVKKPHIFMNVFMRIKLDITKNMAKFIKLRGPVRDLTVVVGAYSRGGGAY